MFIPSVCSLVKPENVNAIFGSGRWIDDVPVGVTIHYAADRKIDRAISWLNSQNFGYHFMIDRDGTIHQTCLLNKTVNHAGNSRWNSCRNNNSHVSICLMSWGKLSQVDDKFYTWSGKTMPLDSIVMRPNLQGNLLPWDKATVEQEASLQILLTWFISLGIDPNDICGHDECCIPQGIKQDPGGILSIPVSEIRKFFIEKRK